MAQTVEENAAVVLEALYAEAAKTSDQFSIDGERVQQLTGLTPEEINDAVSILLDAGLVEWLQVLGTAPFDFANVWITPRGKVWCEQAKEESERNPSSPESKIYGPITPEGSPYGFKEEDWEIVAENKSRGDILSVVFGHQFASEFYDPDSLKANVEMTVRSAVEAYNSLKNAIPVTLDFRSLAAGYGEHLFNEICRDIISADIAIFDTSDLNPNVMLEMGVALTWGVRVLPIKRMDRSKPPSDISGQTWVDYDNSGQTFIDPDHPQKMLRMIERAARKKQKSKRR